MPRAKAKFYWDTAQRAYRYESGRAVAGRTLEKWIDAVTEGARGRMASITSELVNGTINVSDWQLRMLDEIRNGHRAMAMVANGGRAQMTPSAWGRVGAVVKEQRKYLQNFANQIQNGEVAVNGALVTRAQLYGAAMYPSYIGAFRDREIEAGATEERSILTPADGWCGECVDQAGLDWVPMGELVPIGDRECMMNCRCSYETRGADGAITED